MVTKHDSACDETSRPAARPLTLAGLMAALATAACMTPPYSDAPVATNFPRQAQQKPQSPSHWAVIADDLVDQIRPAITGNVVFVKKPAAESEFSKTFRTQVISTLSSKGYKINREASPNVLTLEFDAQLMHFSPGRYQNKNFFIAAIIPTSYWVLRGLDVNNGTLKLIGTEAAAGAIDWNSWFSSQYPKGTTPEYELIVTMSVSNASQILGQRTDVYYIEDSDRGLYLPPPPTPAKMNIKGGA